MRKMILFFFLPSAQDFIPPCEMHLSSLSAVKTGLLCMCPRHYPGWFKSYVDVLKNDPYKDLLWFIAMHRQVKIKSIPSKKWSPREVVIHQNFCYLGSSSQQIIWYTRMCCYGTKLSFLLLRQTVTRTCLYIGCSVVR